VIPPHVTAVLSDEAGSQRDRHIDMIEAKGRLEWQKATGYGRRSLVETKMGRYKQIIGPQLRARSFAGQQTEAAVARISGCSSSAWRHRSIRGNSGN
jgi:hypothetical protein